MPAPLAPVFVLFLLAQTSDPGPVAADARVERGRYLVHDVAQCVECHTPRDGEGRLVSSQLLHGAPVPLASPWRARVWALRAPHIAGLPGYDDGDFVRLLREGIARSGRPPAPPMPRFRMSQDDAEAVLAYLRSIR